MVQVDTNKRDKLALDILEQHEGKINNKDVIAQVKKEVGGRWDTRDYSWLNTIRKRNKFPLPPKGGFRMARALVVEERPVEDLTLLGEERVQKKPAGERFESLCAFVGMPITETSRDLVEGELWKLGANIKPTLNTLPVQTVVFVYRRGEPLQVGFLEDRPRPAVLTLDE